MEGAVGTPGTTTAPMRPPKLLGRQQQSGEMTSGNVILICCDALLSENAPTPTPYRMYSSSKVWYVPLPAVTGVPSSHALGSAGYDLQYRFEVWEVGMNICSERYPCGTATCCGLWALLRVDCVCTAYKMASPSGAVLPFSPILLWKSHHKAQTSPTSRSHGSCKARECLLKQVWAMSHANGTRPSSWRNPVWDRARPVSSCCSTGSAFRSLQG
eukprot:366560-Chlamydomonas_euryale.AAC.3